MDKDEILKNVSNLLLIGIGFQSLYTPLQVKTSPALR